MHIYITGIPGSGKSTLCQRVIKALDLSPSGFLTRKKMVDGIRVGFDLLSLTHGETSEGVPVARLQEGGKPLVFQETFTRQGTDALRNALINGSDLILMDEIGRFEAGNVGFEKAVREVLDQKRIPVMVVLKKEDLPFIREIWGRDDGLHLDLDEKNREACYDEAIAHLAEKREERL